MYDSKRVPCRNINLIALIMKKISTAEPCQARCNMVRGKRKTKYTPVQVVIGFANMVLVDFL
jgi:hypothetical protein